MSVSPENLIEGLGTLMGTINGLRASLDAEQLEIAEQWEALGRIGGQRADHAASLLSRLRPALTRLASFCNDCEQQITDLVRDPFQREDG